MICFFFFGKEKFVLLALPFAYIYISIYIYLFLYILFFGEEILNVWNVCYIRNIHV